MHQVLQHVFPNIWAVLLIPALVLVGVAELGYRSGLRLHRARDTARKGAIGGIQGAVLGLLGLLLGFTFAMAVGRHDMRLQLVVNQANAIGTTFLRASLPPAERQEPVRDLLRRYVELDIEVQPLADDPARLAEGLHRGAELQRRLWEHATAAAKEAPTAMAFVNALNEAIDAQRERVAASRSRIPPSVWLLLLVVAALGCFTSDYAAGAEGARSAFSSLVLPLLIALVMALIYDIATPRQGMIGISQQALVDLRQSMRPPPE